MPPSYLFIAQLNLASRRHEANVALGVNRNFEPCLSINERNINVLGHSRPNLRGIRFSLRESLSMHDLLEEARRRLARRLSNGATVPSL